MEQTVVARYKRSVLPPILPNLDGSPIPATPVMIENKTKGTAISFNPLIKIFQNGSIKSPVKSFQPNFPESTAKMTPRTIAIRIFQ